MNAPQPKPSVAESVPVMPPYASLPASMQALRSDRERLFCWYYMLGNATGADAAREAGFSDQAEGAKVRAWELLNTRDDIQVALTELGQRYLFNLMPKALRKLDALLEHPNPQEQGKAIERVLNRVKGFSEKTSVDLNVSGEITLNETDKALVDLRSLLALGVPRDALIATFGASGLSRYEKMLAEQDRKALPGPVIEQDVVEVK